MTKAPSPVVIRLPQAAPKAVRSGTDTTPRPSGRPTLVSVSDMSHVRAVRLRFRAARLDMQLGAPLVAA